MNMFIKILHNTIRPTPKC